MILMNEYYRPTKQVFRMGKLYSWSVQTEDKKVKLSMENLAIDPLLSSRTRVFAKPRIETEESTDYSEMTYEEIKQSFIVDGVPDEPTEEMSANPDFVKAYFDVAALTKTDFVVEMRPGKFHNLNFSISYDVLNLWLESYASRISLVEVHEDGSATFGVEDS
jgi:hypothetical protein